VSARQAYVFIAALGLHLILIVLTSIQDIAASMATGVSILPAWFEPVWRRTEVFTSTILGERGVTVGLFRESLATYADCTGIEAGYSYFAPNVPGSCKLAFELHYPDGRIEYDLPPVGGAAAGYRISTLLDHLETFHYARLRKAVLRPLVEAVRREHPDVTTVRAVLGVANLPTIKEYKGGKRVSYDASYAYDFQFRPPPSPPVVP
jgi:hypothetical protein